MRRSPSAAAAAQAGREKKKQQQQKKEKAEAEQVGIVGDLAAVGRGGGIPGHRLGRAGGPSDRLTHLPLTLVVPFLRHTWIRSRRRGETITVPVPVLGGAAQDAVFSGARGAPRAPWGALAAAAAAQRRRSLPIRAAEGETTATTGTAPCAPSATTPRHSSAPCATSERGPQRGQFPRQSVNIHHIQIRISLNRKPRINPDLVAAQQAQALTPPPSSTTPTPALDEEGELPEEEEEEEEEIPTPTKKAKAKEKKKGANSAASASSSGASTSGAAASGGTPKEKKKYNKAKYGEGHNFPRIMYVYSNVSPHPAKPA